VIDALLGAIPREPWFASLGEALSEPELSDMAAYLRGLGFPDMHVVAARDWTEAGRIITDPAWEQRWWNAEETQRADLVRRASASIGETALLEILSRVTQAAHDATIGAAAMAATRAGISDPGLIRAASGAATQACYQGAAALLAGAGDEHSFAAKLRLFRAGRWVLGIVRGSAYVL
jgi:hypothetical protein